LDAFCYVGVDFDYPDLDVFFLAMENSETIILNESNFDRELTQDDKPMIVDFWAEWCGPCKMIAPLLDEIAREKAGAVKVAKVNVDDNQSLSFKYNIRAIPALLFFKYCQLRDQIIGVTSKKVVLWRLEALSLVFFAGAKIPVTSEG
jgi:thioredoxin 1